MIVSARRRAPHSVLPEQAAPSQPRMQPAFTVGHLHLHLQGHALATSPHAQFAQMLPPPRSLDELWLCQIILGGLSLTAWTDDLMRRADISLEDARAVSTPHQQVAFRTTTVFPQPNDAGRPHLPLCRFGKSKIDEGRRTREILMVIRKALYLIRHSPCGQGVFARLCLLRHTWLGPPTRSVPRLRVPF